MSIKNSISIPIEIKHRRQIKDNFTTQLIQIYIKHEFFVTEKEGFLLISFSDSEKVNIITKYFESKNPLTFEQVKSIYEKFFKLGKKLDCHQYRLICPTGFEPETDYFSNVNLALSGKEYLESIEKINHIELYSHNDIAYTKLCKQLDLTDKACVIQPTGTGKSLVLSKFITERPNSKFVVLAPGKFIISQIKKHLLNLDNIEFYTYSKLTFLTVKEVKNLNPDYIIVDEFHRCGADEWGAGVQLLLKTYPIAKLIGTTATHIRYLDDKRNMADELFEGNIAHHLTLSKALALGILPTPKYISALYKFDEDYLRVKKSIAESMAEDKKVLLERLNKIRLEFENTNSIPSILKEHLTGDIQKIIVFTKDIKHLRKHKEMVLNWFKNIGYDNIYAYEVHSENEVSNKPFFQDFEQFHDRLDIMFSVNMLNEGIHVKGVNCVIMLRDTESPIIYYQQMGRCLTVGAEKPLIFDLVNNFANIRHRNIQNDVSEEFLKLSELYKLKGIPYEEISFNIIDKVRDIKDLLDDIERTADSWNVFFEKLEIFKNKHGHCNVPQRYSDKFLAIKINNTRQSYKNKALEQWVIDRLNQMGFVWNPYETAWNEFFTKLEAFKKEYGHCNVPNRYSSDKSLGQKVQNTRQDFKKGDLEQWVIDRLNQMGFVWNPYETAWNEFFTKLEAFKTEYGHCNVPQSYFDKSFANKIGTIRKSYKTKALEQWVIDKCNEMGFDWNPIEAAWNEFFTKLEAFKTEFGHYNVPRNYKDQTLAQKTSHTRESYHKGTLSQWVIDRLNQMGFVWSPYEAAWNEFFTKLEAFKKEHGHCNVPARYKDKWLAGKISASRQDYKNGTIEQWVIDRLNQMGFVWNPYETAWNEFFTKLEAFKKEHGHCNVPLKYQDKSLGKRVSYTRELFKKETLEQWVIDKCNKMGFIWSMQK